MNGSRIALVLGLAGLAGLGLATPGMLGAGAQPERAPIPLPAAQVAAAEVAAPAGCTLEAEPVRLEALVPECEPAAQVTRVAEVAAAEPTARGPVQTLRAGAVLYPVDRQQVVRPVSVYAGLPKNAATPSRSQMLIKQRKVLGRSYAAGKALPAGQSLKAQALVPGEQARAEYSPDVSSSARDAHSGAVRAEPVRSPLPSGSAIRAPIEKLPPPK